MTHSKDMTRLQQYMGQAPSSRVLLIPRPNALTTISSLIELLKQKQRQSALGKNTPENEANDLAEVVNNERQKRSTNGCGSCQCSVNKDVATLTNCPSNSNGFLEIVNVNYRVAILKPLLKNKPDTSVMMIIKDTELNTVEGFEGAKFRHLVFENNPRLQIHKNTSIKLETLELRTKALDLIETDVFQPKRLIVSNLMSSLLTDYATSESWSQMCRHIVNLVFEGEFDEIVSIDGCLFIENVTLKNAHSSKTEIIPKDFLKDCQNLEVVAFDNTSQASLPEYFLSQSGAKDLLLQVDVHNARQYSFDVIYGIKSLNNQTLNDQQKDILTSSSNSSNCNVFCANNDCQADGDELARKNCAICVRVRDGPDDLSERTICRHYPAIPPTRPPSSASNEYDYGDIDYWPNEGYDYMNLVFDDSSQNDRLHEHGVALKLAPEFLQRVLLLTLLLLFM
ncbi:uncharacterized protein LOC142354237 isoform X2 [Convolutriloba macropyga]|uniref:uncharacterized protein LOC142354237 isoform X2 n=1 Tax=Convolutriloba macropyga TaxID=536237 RepID=UPI003F51B82D